MKNNISKIFYIFIFTCISLHIFIFDLDIINASFFSMNNAIYLFFSSLWLSMNNIDISWFIIGIFIFDFYYSIYFIDGSWKINRLIVIWTSAVISIIILVIISLYNYHNLKMLFASFVQIYKCLLVGMGYYLIIYAFLKKMFFNDNKN